MLPERIGQALAHARHSVEQGQTTALVVLVARHGTIVLHEAAGALGGSAGAALDKAAIFPLMSIGKVITATSVMILAEEGEVGLNRPVQEYLPEFAGDGKDLVMVHHLLTHSSGIVDDDVVAYQERARGSVPIPPADPNQHPRVHEALCLRWDAPLSKPPGTEMSYSGAGYGLLAEIVRRRSGMNLGEFSRRRIFEPLGMRDSFYAVPEAALARLVHRPADYPDAARLEDPEFRDIPGGSVGGHSTAMDMAIFCQTFLNGGSYGPTRLLSPPAVREMTRNQIPGLPSLFKEDEEREASRGYGWDVKGGKKPRFHGSLDSPAAYTHQGSGGTSIMVDPTYGLVVVYFSVAKGIMSPDLYRPAWSMDTFTNMVISSIAE